METLSTDENPAFPFFTLGCGGGGYESGTITSIRESACGEPLTMQDPLRKKTGSWFTFKEYRTWEMS